MTKLALTDIGIGTIAGDGTGDTPFVAGGNINSNNTALKTAVNGLAADGWSIDNTSETLTWGEKVICNSHAGITKTLPAAQALVTDDVNTIEIINSDTNSNVTITPDGTDGLFVEGISIGGGGSYVLAPGYKAVLVYRSAGLIDVLKVATQLQTLGDGISDTSISSIASDELLKWNGSAWINNTLEEANIVARDVPSFEATPRLFHQSLGAITGTNNIDMADDPSVYATIGSSGVTIHLVAPTYTLPDGGLADIKLAGKVYIKMTAAVTGPLVTTTAGTTIGTFPKGTPPAASGEWAILAWEYFDDGTTDFCWAEWDNDT